MSFFGSKHPFGLIYGGCLTAGSKCTGADGACAWGGDAELRSAAVIGPTSEHEGGPTKVMREFRRGGASKPFPCQSSPCNPELSMLGSSGKGAKVGAARPNAPPGTVGDLSPRDAGGLLSWPARAHPRGEWEGGSPGPKLINIIMTQLIFFQFRHHTGLIIK